MDMQKLTGALPSSSKELKPNFPLPRELRDQIYGYLLDGDFTRIARVYDHAQAKQNLENNSTGFKAYHFHTNILAVNRTIHDESQELLYKRNLFVVVSYQWPGMNVYIGGLTWIPIVSNQHVSRMRHHSLRVHASARPMELNTVARVEGSKVPILSYIILARDLGAFRATMHLDVVAGTSSVVELNTEVGVGAHVSDNVVTASKAHQTTLRCELRDTQYRQMGPATQYQLLAPLSYIVGPGQRVIFTGSVCNLHEAELFKRSMSPSLVCQTARAWSSFESFMLVKDTIDANVMHDDVYFTHMLYTTLNQAIRMSIDDWGTYGWAERNVPGMIQAVLMFHLEVMINCACGCLKIGDMKGLIEMFFMILQCNAVYTQRWDYDGPPGIRAYLKILRLWITLYADSAEMTMEKAIALFENQPVGPHQTHDFDKIKALPDQTVILTKDLFPLDQCSVMMLPFPATSYYKGAKECMQLGHYHGLQDVELLKSLEPSLKAKINELQKGDGLEITDFDSL